MTKQKLYIILILACFSGYAWLYVNMSDILVQASSLNACMFKSVTSIPCPSCGATRSVLSLLHGNYLEAFYWNPFGYIVALIMVVAPIWVCYDYLCNTSSLYIFYNKMEFVLKKREIAIPAIILVLINWFWNIYKCL